jgi:hypothetical protein
VEKGTLSAIHSLSAWKFMCNIFSCSCRSVFYDCLGFNMDQFDPNRMTLDACFGQEIRDTSRLAAEDGMRECPST